MFLLEEAGPEDDSRHSYGEETLLYFVILSVPPGTDQPSSSFPGIEGGVHSYERVAHLQCARFCIDTYQL